MSETKFTKGEWLVERQNGRLYVTDGNSVIAKKTIEGMSIKEEDEAVSDINLIVAAPEMYEELEKQAENIKKVIDQLINVKMDDAWTICKLNDMLGDINDQLAKARGEL